MWQTNSMDEQDCKAIEYAAKNLQCQDCKNLFISSSLRSCNCDQSKHCYACIQDLRVKIEDDDVSEYDEAEDEVRNINQLNGRTQCACTEGICCN